MTLKNVFRIIKRDSLSLITNTTGLSLGLAASILLTAFILFELSYDRHFSQANRICRLNSILIESGEKEIWPINLRSAYTDIPEQVSGIEASVQFYRGSWRELTLNENRYQGLQLLYVDPDFFRVFDLKLLEGNPNLALRETNGVILTEKLARRIFGTTQATGQSLDMEGKTYTVTAVTEDVPPNTHFQFDMLMPMEAVDKLLYLGGLEFFTYYLMEKDADHEMVRNTICSENTKLLEERFDDLAGSSFSSNTEMLERVHLHTDVSWDLTPPGSMKNIMIMLLIVITVMFLALSNFVNLYILNGARRSKEIGIRKVNGASRLHMIKQFYSETTVVVTIAFLVGTGLSLLLIPEFGRVMQRESYMEIISSPWLYIVLTAVYLATILVSGIYPALLLSRSSPVPLILGMVNPAGDKRLLLRLVSILQIAIAIFLLTNLMGINTQIRYLKSLSPGYNPENILLVSNLNDQLVENYPALRDRLQGISGVENVAASVHTIGAGYSGQSIRMYGELPDKSRGISEYRVQPGLCDLYQFTLKQGRFLEFDRPADKKGVILNEAAVSMLGSSPEEIVGQSIIMHEDPLEVVGVVKDFLYESAARQVEPMIITTYQDWIRALSIRFSSDSDPGEIIHSVDNTIKSFDEDYIIMHRFASDIYYGYYEGEEWLRNIMGAGSILSILIVLLGIWALVSHHILNRTKEIGIRKVMGGSSREILLLVYASTLKWNVAAHIIAVPMAWLYLNNWLTDYSIRIPIYWWLFAISILIVLLFQALVTMGQTWRTARRNPVEALRYE